jgi:dystroglycan 1
MVFKATSLDDGLLLYNGYDSTGTGDFLALSLRDGHVVFQFDTGSGPADIRSSEKISVDEWVTVVVERNRQDGSLIVNDAVAVKGSVSGDTVGLNLKTSLYLGAVDWTKVRVSPLVGIDVGFQGCVSELSVGGRPVDLTFGAIDSKNVNQCDGGQDGGAQSRVCTPTTCQNGGTCREYGARGTFECSCTLGFTGTNCEISAVVVNSAQFNGDGSYVELPSSLIADKTTFTVRLTVSTTQSEAIVFWLGQTATMPGRGRDYVAIAVLDGYPVFSFELGSGPANVSGPTRVNDGHQHEIIVTRSGQSGRLQVDQSAPIEGTSGGRLTSLNTHGNIYIGGLPDGKLMTAGKFPYTLVGCVSDVHVQNVGPLSLTEHAVRGVNVRPCDF